MIGTPHYPAYGAIGGRPIAGTSLSDGLVAAWHFGVAPFDMVSGGLVGTLGGGATIGTRGVLGQCLVLDVSAMRWDLNIPVSLQIGQPLTLVARWASGVAGGGANRFGIFRDGSNYGYGLSETSNTHRIEWSSGTTGGTRNTGVSNTAYPSGVTAVRFSSTMRDMWMNGIRIDGVTGSYSDATYSGTPKLILGSGATANEYIEYFLIYRRLLTPEEMLLLQVLPYAWMSFPAWDVPYDVASAGSSATGSQRVLRGVLNGVMRGAR